MKKNPIILLLVVVIVVILYFYMAPQSSMQGTYLNDKAISSSKCTNLDRNASLCIARDDTGTPTSIGWFQAEGCPLSEECPSPDPIPAGSTLTKGDRSNISKPLKKGEFCTDGTHNECLDKVKMKRTVPKGTVPIVDEPDLTVLNTCEPYWWIFTHGSDVDCTCYNFCDPAGNPTYTCTTGDLNNPPASCQ
jgi:hypothetical protein